MQQDFNNKERSGVGKNTVTEGDDIVVPRRPLVNAPGDATFGDAPRRSLGRCSVSCECLLVERMLAQGWAGFGLKDRSECVGWVAPEMCLRCTIPSKVTVR